MNIHEVIDDSSIFSQHYILREGFEFKPLTHPANVYDALVIKSPSDAVCEYPRIVNTGHSLFEQIEFVNRHNLEKAIIVADNIDFISKCPTLRHIDIIPANGVGNGFDFSPLYGMPEIKTLYCRTEYGIGDKFLSQVDYSRINGIENLGISGKGHINYKQIKTLKTLGISQYKGMDLSDLFCSKELDTLSMIQCSVRTLDGIEQSDKMQCVYLSYDRTLCDIEALSRVKKTVRALSIENCPKIKDFSVLTELENLEFLELLGKNVLPDLKFIRSMKNLKTFVFNMNVLDGDLSPCMDLSYVHSLNDRRHFNIKNKDLPKNKYYKGNDNIEEWRRF